LVRAGLRSLDAELLEPESLEFARLWIEHSNPRLAIVEPLEYPDAVRELVPLLPVVILTASTNVESLYRAVTDGVSGYLHVSASLQSLKSTVDVILAGGTQLDVTYAARIVRTLTLARQEFLHSPSTLTRRELEVLGLLATGLTNDEIAKRLTLAPSTVTNAVSRVLGALGVRNRVEATLWAVRAGLVNYNETKEEENVVCV